MTEISGRAVAKGEKSPPVESLASEQAFIQRVRQLQRGDLAILKRSAGSTMAEARNCHWFYRLLDEEARRTNPELYFLVATLFGLNKYEARGDFGHSMARLSRAGNPEAVERRFLVLLDAQFDREGNRAAGGEMAFRLRQMVKLAASKEVGVDWAQLLHDLNWWEHPSRFIQKKWASSFYPPPASLEKAQPNP